MSWADFDEIRRLMLFLKLNVYFSILVKSHNTPWCKMPFFKKMHKYHCNDGIEWIPKSKLFSIFQGQIH